jgi:hypothetical protein
VLEKWSFCVPISAVTRLCVLVDDLLCGRNDANRALERIKLISWTSVGHLLPNDLLSKR